MSLNDEVFNEISELETAVILSAMVNNEHERIRNRLSKELDKGVDNLWKLKK